MPLAPSPASELRYSHGQPSSDAAQRHSPTYDHGHGGDALGLQEGFLVQPQLLALHRALHRGQRLQHPAGAAGRLGAARGGSGAAPGVPPAPDSQQGGPQHPPSRRLRRQPRARPHGAGPGSASARGGAAPARLPPPGSPPAQNCREAAGPRNIQNDLLKSNLKQKSSSRSVECR